MKIDQRLLRELLALPDDELWKRICAGAAERGLKLPAATPPPETLQRLRATVKDGGGLRLGEAISIIGRYAKEQKS